MDFTSCFILFITCKKSKSNIIKLESSLLHETLSILGFVEKVELSAKVLETCDIFSVFYIKKMKK
jgi:hypothetical protein